MGYSIGMTPRTPKLGQQALEFGLKHFRAFKALQGDEPTEGLRFVLGDMSYDRHPKHLGFDYASGSENRALVWALAIWLAQRIGRKMDGLPYVVYDGIERIPVDPEIYGDDGWFREEYIAKQNLFRHRELQVTGRLVKPELERLSKLWDEQ